MHAIHFDFYSFFFCLPFSLISVFYLSLTFTPLPIRHCHSSNWHFLNIFEKRWWLLSYAHHSLRQSYARAFACIHTLLQKSCFSALSCVQIISKHFHHNIPLTWCRPSDKFFLTNNVFAIITVDIVQHEKLILFSFMPMWQVHQWRQLMSLTFLFLLISSLFFCYFFFIPGNCFTRRFLTCFHASVLHLQKCEKMRERQDIFKWKW